MDALEELAHFNLERTGELHDIFHPDVSFAAFDPADVRPMQPRFFCQLFLRPFLFQSQLTNSFSEQSESGGRTPAQWPTVCNPASPTCCDPALPIHITSHRTESMSSTTSSTS